jgi:SAM-dependent methyltransferase
MAQPTSIQSTFDRSWQAREEAHYNHWIREKPRNQIQLAFRRHWLTFGRYLNNLPGNEVLEVGCGRGTIGSYFADAGYRVTLLDSSPAVLSIARKIYRANRHGAHYVAGDAFSLPFGNDRFAACVSIGLLEHFDDIGAVMAEQLRVLRPNGVMLAYVVPERPDSVQRHFHWLNRLLGRCSRLFSVREAASSAVKAPLYRNGLTAAAYLSALDARGVTAREACGMYPLPMISHSPEFPFSLLPDWLERGLVTIFSGVLMLRRALFGKDPWTCKEHIGQAFLVVARKPTSPFQ